MSGLRVIGGEARGRRLKMVPGDTTRPIADRVKEALFNILAPSIDGAVFMDLFAGTGSVGIEALSRGASHAWFLDLHPKAIKTIQENLSLTGFAYRATVLQANALDFLATQEPEGFDYVYIAPPQYQSMWKAALLAIESRTDWLNPDGRVIAQIDPREYEDLRLSHLPEVDRRTYGNTQLVFFERPGW